MSACCKSINEDAEIHYWTSDEDGAPCECGQKHRLTAEKQRQAKVAAFHEWFGQLAGRRR